MNDQSVIERLDPPTLARPAGYAHIAITAASRTAYIAGQVGCTADGVVEAKGDIENQSRAAMLNIRRALEAIEADMTNVVKLTVYVVGLVPDYYRPIILGFKDAWSDGGWVRVPMAIIGVEALADPDALIEVDAIAAVE